MKLGNNYFENYVSKKTFHPKLEKLYNSFPTNIDDLCHLILYGASGVGKYTQALKIISKYSPTELKYEKKISIVFNKNTYFYKISDIHFEVDMNLLGCNSKQLWNEIYGQFIDIVSAKTINNGIFLCKNFHDIHGELLDVFYSYIQNSPNNYCSIKFIILTDHLSFIPDNIVNCTKIINISRPSRSTYKACFKNIPSDINSITNLKHLSLNIKIESYNNLINKLYNEMFSNHLRFLSIREILYEVLIFNIDVYEFMWRSLTKLIKNNKIKQPYLPDVMNKMSEFFQYYNNNYRPIYHLEKYIYYLLIKINGYPEC